MPEAPDSGIGQLTDLRTLRSAGPHHPSPEGLPRTRKAVTPQPPARIPRPRRGEKSPRIPWPHRPATSPSRTYQEGREAAPSAGEDAEMFRVPQLTTENGAA